MIAQKVSTPETPPHTYRAWHIVPAGNNSNRFVLETTTGDVVCTLAFPEDDTATHTTFLNLIASAPELQDIAEMYHSTMIGSRAEKSMIFDIVCEILNRLQ